MDPTHFKKCPRCGSAARLEAAECANCGRQYRTQFAPPADQTQMFSAGGLHSDPTVMQSQSAPAPAAPSYAPAAPAGGPLDNTERSVSMVWTGIWLVVVTLFLATSIHRIFQTATTEAGHSPFTDTFGLPWLLGSASLFSFLVMRLRRLYLAAPSGALPGEIQRRRNHAAVAASFLVAGVIAGGLLWPEPQERPQGVPLGPPPIPATANTPSPTAVPYPGTPPAAPRRFVPGRLPGTYIAVDGSLILPCGHRYARQEGSAVGVVAVCEQGHAWTWNGSAAVRVR